MKRSITFFRSVPGSLENRNEPKRGAFFKTVLQLIVLLFGGAFYAQTTQTFTSDGTFTPAAGVTTVQVQAWGGGGAGGGVNGSSTQTRAGGGGGGGSYRNVNSVAVTPGVAISVTVGQGGQGVSQQDGQAGEASLFNSAVPVSAAGGAGGQHGDSGQQYGVGGAAGSGHTFNGGSGANATSSGSGGGGGAAGTSAHGGNGSVTSGGAGGAGNTSGDGGNGRASSGGGTTGNGNAGGVIGGGGSGGRSTNSTDREGGDGARGEVRVTYTCPSYNITAAPTNNGPFCGASASTITIYSSSMTSATYTVTYNLSGATSGSNLTASVNFTAGSPGTGTFNTGLLNVGNTTVTIVEISSGSCDTTINSGNTTVVTVNPTLPASVSISADDASVCPGAMITFTATPTNGGTSPSYQWKVNGGNVGTDSPTFQSSSLVDGDDVTVEMTSNATPCLTGSPATSNTIEVTIHALPTAVSVSPVNPTVCVNAVTQLTATGGQFTANAFSENFNGAHGFTASGSVSAGSAWSQRTSPYNVSLVANWNTTPESGSFMLAYIAAFSASNGNTQLTSPSIDVSNFTSLNLSYRHTYKKGTEAGVSVQVSTNGGANWTNVKTHTSNQGGAGSFVTDNIDLTSYAGSASLMIRYNYVATQSAFGTAWWAVDNVVLSGSGSSIIWSPTAGLYNDAAATIPYSGTSQTSVYAKLTAGETYTATSTTPNGCSVSGQTVMSVQALPTLGGVSQAAVCEDTNATIALHGLTAGGTYNITYTINAGAPQNANGVAADGSGEGSFQVVVALANNGQTLAITNIVRTDNSPSCSFAPTSNNTVALAVNQNITYYADTDGDGFGDINSPMVSCMGAPEGHVLDNTDCNDNDDTVHAEYFFYVDSDEDGFGTGSSVAVCAVDENTPPVGYSLNDTDCNDADASMHETFSFYVDADLDNYGAGELVSGICAVDGSTPPAGYSTLDTDCNDALASTNPGAADIAYDGIDNNCNGTIDEGNQVFSQVLTSQCGTTLVNIGSLIGCISVPAGTGYRFEVTNTQTMDVQVIDRFVPNFSLTHLAVYDYATTYSIRVMVQRNFVWLNYYGDSCLVSTPAVTSPEGAAQVSPSQCGVTLPSINTLIATTSLAGVAQYRFRVTDLTDADGPNQVQIIDRPLHWFSLKMLTRYNYGTTYSIEVAVRTTGSSNFTGFGAPCNVSTPAVPQITVCGANLAAPWTNVPTVSLNSVTSYRFVVTNFNTLAVTTIDRPLHWFNFTMIPDYVPGDMYGVQVAVMTSGEWSPFSDGCEITAPAAARGNVKEEAVAFNAVAYPNPFADSFNIELTTSAESDVNLKVYDMTGRMLESKEVKATEMQALEVGENYPAGVYNVIVSQGDQAKTMRVIKR